MIPTKLYDVNNDMIRTYHVVSTSNMFYFHSFNNLDVEVIEGDASIFDVRNVDGGLVTTEGTKFTGNTGYTLYFKGNNKSDVVLKIGATGSEESSKYKFTLLLENELTDEQQHYNDLLINHYLPTFEELEPAILPGFNKREMLKRMLLDFRNILKKKGTKQSIEKFFALIGFVSKEQLTVTDVYLKPNGKTSLKPNKLKDVKTGDYHVVFNNWNDGNLFDNVATVNDKNMPYRPFYVSDLSSLIECIRYAIPLANKYFTAIEQDIIFFGIAYSANGPMYQSITSVMDQIHETDTLAFRKDIKVNIKNITYGRDEIYKDIIVKNTIQQQNKTIYEIIGYHNSDIVNGGSLVNRVSKKQTEINTFGYGAGYEIKVNSKNTSHGRLVIKWGINSDYVDFDVNNQNEVDFTSYFVISNTGDTIQFIVKLYDIHNNYEEYVYSVKTMSSENCFDFYLNDANTNQPIKTIRKNQKIKIGFENEILNLTSIVKNCIWKIYETDSTGKKNGDPVLTKSINTQAYNNFTWDIPKDDVNYTVTVTFDINGEVFNLELQEFLIGRIFNYQDVNHLLAVKHYKNLVLESMTLSNTDMKRYVGTEEKLIPIFEPRNISGISTVWKAGRYVNDSFVEYPADEQNRLVSVNKNGLVKVLKRNGNETAVVRASYGDVYSDCVITPKVMCESLKTKLQMTGEETSKLVYNAASRYVGPPPSNCVILFEPTPANSTDEIVFVSENENIVKENKKDNPLVLPGATLPYPRRYYFYPDFVADEEGYLNDGKTKVHAYVNEVLKATIDVEVIAAIRQLKLCTKNTVNPGTTLVSQKTLKPGQSGNFTGTINLTAGEIKEINVEFIPNRDYFEDFEWIQTNPEFLKVIEISGAHKENIKIQALPFDGDFYGDSSQSSNNTHKVELTAKLRNLSTKVNINIKDIMVKLTSLEPINTNNDIIKGIIEIDAGTLIIDSVFVSFENGLFNLCTYDSNTDKYWKQDAGTNIKNQKENGKIYFMCYSKDMTKITTDIVKISVNCGTILKSTNANITYKPKIELLNLEKIKMFIYENKKADENILNNLTDENNNIIPIPILLGANKHVVAWLLRNSNYEIPEEYVNAGNQTTVYEHASVQGEPATQSDTPAEPNNAPARIVGETTTWVEDSKLRLPEWKVQTMDYAVDVNTIVRIALPPTYSSSTLNYTHDRYLIPSKPGRFKLIAYDKKQYSLQKELIFEIIEIDHFEVVSNQQNVKVELIDGKFTVNLKAVSNVDNKLRLTFKAFDAQNNEINVPELKVPYSLKKTVLNGENVIITQSTEGSKDYIEIETLKNKEGVSEYQYGIGNYIIPIQINTAKAKVNRIEYICTTDDTIKVLSTDDTHSVVNIPAKDQTLTFKVKAYDIDENELDLADIEKKFTANILGVDASTEAVISITGDQKDTISIQTKKNKLGGAQCLFKIDDIVNYINFNVIEVIKSAARIELLSDDIEIVGTNASLSPENPILVVEAKAYDDEDVEIENFVFKQTIISNSNVSIATNGDRNEFVSISLINTELSGLGTVEFKDPNGTVSKRLSAKYTYIKPQTVARIGISDSQVSSDEPTDNMAILTSVGNDYMLSIPALGTIDMVCTAYDENNEPMNVIINAEKTGVGIMNKTGNTISYTAPNTKTNKTAYITVSAGRFSCKINIIIFGTQFQIVPDNPQITPNPGPTTIE